MGICWPLTHRPLSSVLEVKQHPGLGAKRVFKKVVVVFEGSSRRNQRQRDVLRAGIRTDASLRCDQAERQRTSVERGQHSFHHHREPFLHLAPHFISLLHGERTQNTPIISASTSGEGGGSTKVKLCGSIHLLLSNTCMRGEIKRKSKPVDVRTGRFQRAIPQHQLAGCAVTGSC